MMNRRETVALLGAAAAWPLKVTAQQPIPVVGLMLSREPGEDSYLASAFRQGLGESGFVEGRNVMIEYRWAGEKSDRWSASAADLVHRQVNVIAAIGDGMAITAQGATASIPTIFVTGVDPVEFRLVASLNRPGGNRTGVSMLNAQLGPKRLQLLYELIPSAAAIGLLINPAVPSAETLLREHQATDPHIGARSPCGACEHRSVQQTTKFELIINVKTAKALSLNVPRTLLARADEVID